MKQMVKRLSRQPFTQEDIRKREHYLKDSFDNTVNIEKLLDRVFSAKLV
jgi:hypothetical protein